MALASYALVDWPTVQNRFNLDASRQEATEHLIEVASMRAKNYVGRILAAEDVTRDLDGNGQRIIDVGEYPINSVASVYVDGNRNFGSETEVTEYVIYKERFLYRAAAWPTGIANIRVSANVGYSQTKSDLEESIIQLVGYWIDSPAISWIGGEEGTEGGYQSQYTGAMDLPFQVVKIWSNYMRDPI